MTMEDIAVWILIALTLIVLVGYDIYHYLYRRDERRQQQDVLRQKWVHHIDGGREQPDPNREERL